MSAAEANGSARRPPLIGRPSTRLAFAVLGGGGLVLVPLAALVATALSSPQAASIWPHLAAHVLPSALAQTLVLLAGVGLLSAVIGVGTAWLVTQYDFAGRRHLEWLLAIPLALPTYITAYLYVDLLGFSGPVQVALRALTGWRSLRDYWFPDPRNIAGAIVIMALVLYPYVYLSTRALFALQSAGITDAARTLGASPVRLFWHIGLPLARPALAAGLTLVLLETLNDIGATEYLGVPSLTLSIYTTWLNRGSLAGAAQIACVMLLVVFVLILAEARLRGRQRFALPTRQMRPLGRRRLSARRAGLATLACSLPVLFGALIPVGYLVVQILRRDLLSQFDLALLRQLGHAVLLSGCASLIVTMLGFAIAAALRRGREPWLRPLARIAGLGYAVPGTVLALGLLIPLARLDNALAEAARGWLGIETGLILIGSGGALVLAYVARFLTIGIAGVDSGFARLSPRIDDAARILGARGPALLRELHWPLVRSATAAAALLVFVDGLKELPATLLLRPLAFETLATSVYGHASRGVFEDGALAALLIILAGLYPAVILVRTGQDRRG